MVMTKFILETAPHFSIIIINNRSSISDSYIAQPARRCQSQKLSLLKSEAHPDYQPAPAVTRETISKDVFETRTGNNSAEECPLTAEGELRAQPHAFFRSESGTSNSSSVPAVSLLSTLTPRLSSPLALKYSPNQCASICGCSRDTFMIRQA